MSRAKGLVVDADAHVAEDIDALQRAFPAATRHLAPRLEAPPGLDGPLWLNGSRLHARFTPPAALTPAAAMDPLERVAHLDAEGIDVAVLFPTIGLLFPIYRQAEPATDFCRAVNDWVAAFCDTAPHRLAPVALIPHHDPDMAVDELERTAAQGAVAAVLRPNPIDGRTVASPEFDDLWDAATQHDIAVVLHEGTFDIGIETLGSDRATTYGELHAMAHPFELMALLAQLFSRGVLDRHPELRVGCFEAGFGWGPYWEHRLEEHSAVYGDGRERRALRSHVWVTAETDEATLRLAPELGWKERVCFATDYPHADALEPGGADRARVVTDSWSDEFLGDNALELFGERLRRRLRP